MTEMISPSGAPRDGGRTLLGASALTAGVVGAVAAASAAARRTGAIPRTPEQRWREAHPHESGQRGGTGTAERADGTGSAGGQPRPGKAPSPDDPRKPKGPEDLHKPTLRYSLRKTGREFGSDQCTDLAAALVYYSVLALGPAIIAIVSILGLLSPDTIAQLDTQVLQPALASSPSTYSLIHGLLTNASKAPSAGLGLIIGIVGALWSASGYVGAFGRAMNRIYSIPEGRPVWKLRPTQLLVTIAVVVLVVLGALILVSTGPIVQQIAGQLGIGDAAFVVFSIVKWPILIVIAIAAIAILYYFSPNVRQPKFRWTSMGSIFALVVWAVVTVLFGLYLSFSGGGSYSKTYGPIAGIIIFLLWLWITNLALLFGAEFDAELERSRELQGGIAAEEQIQLPMRDTRGSDKKEQKHEEDVQKGRELRQSRGTKA
ncbi:MAG TPA: YihY/virulence factor BrkB family protein [Amnibacterium sp.]|jgi:membrane protein|uniref:YihY/virulence factor BrkB family protein n=1 Tax=Amnibacterium sp. TaxID=1872496 RepID=UPI002F945068